jgi:hypothetical protein
MFARIVCTGLHVCGNTYRSWVSREPYRPNYNRSPLTKCSFQSLVMAAEVLVRRSLIFLYWNRITSKSRINSNVVTLCNVQPRRNLSFKLLNKLTKDIKKQLGNVKILANLRVSKINGSIPGKGQDLHLHAHFVNPPHSRSGCWI